MLRSIFSRGVANDAIPKHLTTLSVSWLNNQFKAVAVHHGRVEATWERPGETEGAGDFDRFLREAVQHTGYRGHTVSLVLAHPRLVQQLVDVPPVKGAALQKVIQRQAQQQKVFPGDAAFASQMALSDKGTQRIVLHLLPRALLTQLVQGCKKNGLHLTSVLPPSAVLHHQIKQLELPKDQAVLLAAETGGSTTLAVGRADGQILLARTLPGTWNDEPGRLSLDLNRTILFVNQQYGAIDNLAVLLFGPGASNKCDEVQTNVQVPVNISLASYNPFYWTTEALKVRPELAPDLISPELRKAPQRKVFAKAVAIGAAIVVIGSLALASYCWIAARQEAANVRLLATQRARSEARLTQLKQLDTELTRKQEIVRLVLGNRHPPAPAWVMAYLAEAVPAELVLTNIQVNRADDLWKMKLAGVAQPGLKQTPSPSLRSSVDKLEERLSGAPFHVRFRPESGDKSDKQTEPARQAAAGPSWLSRLAETVASRPGAAKPAEDNFTIEGVMQ